MFPTLEQRLEAVRAVRDSEAVRRLCLDCWAIATAKGEAEGLGMAAVLLEGVRDYAAHEARIRGPSFSTH